MLTAAACPAFRGSIFFPAPVLSPLAPQSSTGRFSKPHITFLFVYFREFAKYISRRLLYFVFDGGLGRLFFRDNPRGGGGGDYRDQYQDNVNNNSDWPTPGGFVGETDAGGGAGGGGGLGGGGERWQKHAQALSGRNGGGRGGGGGGYHTQRHGHQNQR